MNPVKEVFAVTVATVLSCGPSQVFGSVKGTVDAVRLFKIIKRQFNFLVKERLAANDWNQFKKTQLFVVIQNKLNKENISQQEVLQYIIVKRVQTKEKLQRCCISLLADMTALIPLIGAHISWRIATGYTQKSYRPLFTRSITHLLENYSKVLGRLLFIGNTKKDSKSLIFKSSFEDSPRIGNKVCIPVCTSTKNRMISALHCLGKRLEDDVRVTIDITAPTIILFHGNDADGDSLLPQANMYQKNGYNTLCVTIGGFGNSSGVTTTEGTIAQDVEAVKHYLFQCGVTQVGYHGISLGGAVALHAAVVESSIELQTLFVVVDKTFTSAKDVGGNLIKNFPKTPPILEFLGRGVLAAAIKPGLSVELPGGKIIKTDGFDNLAKVKVLKEKGIPLKCVKGEFDILMGLGKRKMGRFQRNYADLLFETYYGPNPNKEEQKCLISQKQGHDFSLIKV